MSEPTARRLLSDLHVEPVIEASHCRECGGLLLPDDLCARREDGSLCVSCADLEPVEVVSERACAQYRERA